MKIFYLLLILSVLSSCSQKESVMRYTTWQSSPTEEKIIREILKDFDEVRPDIEYDFQPIPGNYPEKIQLMLGTGNAPDIFWLKADTGPAYLNFEILEELDQFTEQDTSFNYDDFFPVFKNAFQHKGKNFGIAKDFNAYVLFYNKSIFREAGIDTIPTTWESLYEISSKLTRDKNGDGKTDQYGFVVEPSIDMMLPFIFQNNGELISDNNEIKVGNPEFIEAIEFVMSMYRNGIATCPADQGAGWMGDVFSREQCAMTISGAWLIPYLTDNAPELDYGVIELPAGKKKSTVAFTVAMVMPSQSQHKNEAWSLISYLTGKEGMQSWTESGIALPTRKTVAQENGFYDDPVFSVFMNSVEHAQLYKVNMKERWFDESQATMQGIFYKNNDIETSLKRLAKNLEKYKFK